MRDRRGARAADDAVDALLDMWEPQQIALFTTKHRHPAHVQRVDLVGDDTYWDDYFAADDVFDGSVSGFKGLERTCVVLAVNGISAKARRGAVRRRLQEAEVWQLIVVDEIAPTGDRGAVRRRLQEAEV